MHLTSTPGTDGQTPSPAPLPHTEPAGTDARGLKIRAVIVDDEELARQRIRDLLDAFPAIEVVAECRNGAQAVETIRQDRPDLVFLDVSMPDIDGFGVLERIDRDHAPGVIFVTAYDQYALRAFENAAIDYLLKPFDRERFRQAVDRAVERHRVERVGELGRRMEKILGLGLSEVQADREQQRNRLLSNRLVVRQSGTVHLVKVEDIDWVESARNYVKVRCGKDTFTMRDTLANVEGRLDPDRFLRIHRSTLVNLDRIRRIEPGYGSESRVELEDGTKLVVSRAYRRGKVKELLDHLL